ncbi:flagellar basal body-associated FliL family protein [Pragia fontium]|uniref:Flagellar protein FliL n=2 Tax=Pragia fontium TaxID=82985 RepID=A0AAJ4W7M0_9GAMM|nr:flagellar basal body-associated FliL family protein [Pragia fontium]AKJ41403.1 hypothetical protein QQ39_04370 [Pragia fontium]SFC00671.1 flagellar FliL protein [Pragia fontium DSM 5563 = ATCC 49100]SUB81656.1 flagellar basal body-associated protein FliL [Pragia fontium]VEJ54149.1 flagellar basal body-associated protein FliL [Pragia fontium]GKX62963.1 flagellar protein [Pragia fontium]
MKKNIVLALIVAIFSASLTGCVMFFAGNGMATKEQDKEGSGISSLFSSKEKETEVHFVTIKNIVITLNSDLSGNNASGYEHYLLLDLALTAKDTDSVKKIESAIPLIQSSTVNLLTNMKYSDIRNTNVSDLRKKLLAEYQKAYKGLNMTVTFNDVLISKMVFQ